MGLLKVRLVVNFDREEWLEKTREELLLLLPLLLSLQSCPTLCDPIDGSPPGSPIPGILQARIQEWVAIPFSNAWKWKVKGKSLSRVWLFATPWSAAYQAPPSMGFSRQEYWSGVPSPSLVLETYYVLIQCFSNMIYRPREMIILVHKRR